MDEGKAYLVRSYCDSSQKLRAPLNATIGDCAISIREASREHAYLGGSDLSWEYSIRTTAIGPIAAINKAEAYISYLNDVLVFVQGAAIGDPKPFMAIDLDPRFPNREFAQAIYFDFPEFRSRRRLDIDNLRLFFEERLEAFNDQRGKRRLVRALHLLRRSHLERDPIDRFEDLWTALEAINPLVRQKYSIHRDYSVDCSNCRSPLACQNCGQAVTTVDNLSGMRHVICDMLDEEDQWPALRRMRVAIVHSLDDPKEIAEDIPPKIEVLRKALIAGILDLLDVPPGETPRFDHPPLPLSTQPQFVIRGEFLDLAAEAVANDIDNLPHFRLSQSEPLSLEVSGQDMKTERASFSLSPVGFEGRFSYQLQVLLVRGPNDEGVTHIDVRRGSAPPEAVQFSG